MKHCAPALRRAEQPVPPFASTRLRHVQSPASRPALSRAHDMCCSSGACEQSAAGDATRGSGTLHDWHLLGDDPWCAAPFARHTVHHAALPRLLSCLTARIGLQTPLHAATTVKATSRERSRGALSHRVGVGTRPAALGLLSSGRGQWCTGHCSKQGQTLVHDRNALPNTMPTWFQSLASQVAPVRCHVLRAAATVRPCALRRYSQHVAWWNWHRADTKCIGKVLEAIVEGSASCSSQSTWLDLLGT